ncbi:threonine/serine exporter family protein [Lysobacter sp. F6437]|uniref:threonine/serine exporter family protein n=1 Tax=Lysobacter sp. F6437 TaxID=3459296 RepID=UPI00403E0571
MTMSSPIPLSNASYADRIRFMVELAERLHLYGTTAQRLEAALLLVAERLRLECEPWSSPTALILTFSDPQHLPGASDTTRVIRLPPGDNDLHKLAETDRIAEALIAGEMDLAMAFEAMDALDKPATRTAQALRVLGYGLVAAAVGGLLRLPWLDIAVAGFNGLTIGVFMQLAETRPRTREAVDALVAMFATAVAILVATFVAPLNQNTVIIASLIVLLPGLSLTNAMNELASDHLVSGTARFAGAITTVMKLAVGVIISLYIANLVGLQPAVRALRPQPEWVEWGALAAASLAFAVLFRCERRDYPAVMLAAASGYLVSRLVGLAWGSGAGIFLAALVMTAAGNAYARWRQRPGAIVRVPGIILLVPGSASLRGLLDLIQQQDVNAGQVAALGVINILLALIAGLLFGNLLLPARRNL